jgi:hypothetical protein
LKGLSGFEFPQTEILRQKKAAGAA